MIGLRGIIALKMIININIINYYFYIINPIVP